MLPLVLTIFAASILGSLHCAGMCGAFLAIALGDMGTRRAHAISQAAYHGGRLVTYATLGAIAGYAGQAMNLVGRLAGIQQVAVAISGATIIFFGVTSYLRLRGIILKRHAWPGLMTRLSHRGLSAAMNRRPAVRAAMIGLLTTLLPCGWLYAFVVTAAGTASPVRGATAMGAFWLGTLPAMVTLGAGIRGAFGTLGRRMPAITCAAMVMLGLYTVVARGRLVPSRLISNQTSTHHATPCCEDQQP